MIRAIALDDEPPALRVLTHFCNRSDAVTLGQTFTQPAEALAYVQANPVDLLFLDINMPEVSGLDFAQSLPPSVLVIFTTAYAEFAVEGFTLNAVDYLLKPFTAARFEQALAKAADHVRLRQLPAEPAPTHLQVRADYALHQVPLGDILYVEGLDDYLKIHLTTGRPIVARMTMKAILDKLPASAFVRVHRSFIVPLARIESVRNRTITIAGRFIPIGTRYEEAFHSRFLG